MGSLGSNSTSLRMEKNIEMSTIMWGKSENNPFYGAQVWFSNMFNTPRNGQLGHLGDDLSVRLAIGWNDGVQIQGNLSPRYPSQRILPPSFKLFFCSGKGCAQKCSIPRNWIFMEKLLKKHWIYMDFICLTQPKNPEEYSSSWHRTPDSAAAPQI
jgi:hypothetical protein